MARTVSKEKLVGRLQESEHLLGNLSEISQEEALLDSEQLGSMKPHLKAAKVSFKAYLCAVNETKKQWKSVVRSVKKRQTELKKEITATKKKLG